MKALLLYFSGTGNTYYIGKLIKERIHSIVDIDMISIEQISESNIPPHDILFLGFPVYEMDSPSFFQDYIRRLPQASNKGLFLFCTHGGIPGNALRKNFKGMIAKGYIPLGFLKVGMMDSGGITFMKKDSFMVRYIEKREYDKLKTVDRFIKKARKILSEIKNNGNLQHYQIKLPFTLFGFAFDWLWKLLYKIWGKRLKKRFWADNRCNKCGLCEKICPGKNISMRNGKIEFGENCFLCVRCINQCPNEAIQIGKGTIGKFRWKGPYSSFNPLQLLYKNCNSA